MTQPCSDVILQSILAEIRQVAGRVAQVHECLSGRTKSHFTVEEVAEATGRSAYTVRRWISEKLIRAIRIDSTGPRGRLLIPREELRRLIATGRGADLPAEVTDISSQERAG